MNTTPKHTLPNTPRFKLGDIVLCRKTGCWEQYKISWAQYTEEYEERGWSYKFNGMAKDFWVTEDKIEELK